MTLSRSDWRFIARWALVIVVTTAGVVGLALLLSGELGCGTMRPHLGGDGFGAVWPWDYIPPRHDGGGLGGAP